MRGTEIRSCLWRLFLLVAFFSPAGAVHEPILCAWLDLQLSAWSTPCAASDDICTFMVLFRQNSASLLGKTESQKVLLQGVSCSEEGGVTYYDIDLKNEGLSGSLPADLSTIVTLRKL